MCEREWVREWVRERQREREIERGRVSLLYFNSRYSKESLPPSFVDVSVWKEQKLYHCPYGWVFERAWVGEWEREIERETERESLIYFLLKLNASFFIGHHGNSANTFLTRISSNSDVVSSTPTRGLQQIWMQSLPPSCVDVRVWKELKLYQRHCGWVCVCVC